MVTFPNPKFSFSFSLRNVGMNSWFECCLCEDAVGKTDKLCPDPIKSSKAQNKYNTLKYHSCDSQTRIFLLKSHTPHSLETLCSPLLLLMSFTGYR